jgi:hypothetical protein
MRAAFLFHPFMSKFVGGFGPSLVYFFDSRKSDIVPKKKNGELLPISGVLRMGDLLKGGTGFGERR